MSYTNKKVIWNACSKGDYVNESIVGSIYGDIYHEGDITILARKQPHEDVITTAEGKTLLTKNIFYVDPRIEPHALEIEKMDKLDGETVMQKYVMCDLHNKPKMVRYITV